MFSPRLTTNKLRARVAVACCLLFALCALPSPVLAQQPTSQPAASGGEVERGLQLYRINDMKGAAKAFRAAVKKHKADPAVWLYLGQALMWRGELKESLKAHDAALRLAPNLAPAHASRAFLLSLTENAREAEASARRALELDPRQVDALYVLGLLHLRAGLWAKAAEEADRIIKINENVAAAYSLKARAMIGLYDRGFEIMSDEGRGVYDHSDRTVEEVRAAQPRRLREAADNFEKYLRLSPDARDAGEVRSQLEALRAYTQGDDATADAAAKIYKSSEVSKKAVITFRPEPNFTEEARAAFTKGVVRLRAVLAWDGKVKNILVLKGLPHGLTQQAVSAARRIKFTPAVVNGLPVSQWVVIEYNFDFY
jgi:TonB family protein